jgi:hypothetical protein
VYAKLQPLEHVSAPPIDTQSGMPKAATSASKSGTAWARPSGTPSVPWLEPRSRVWLAQPWSAAWDLPSAMPSAQQARRLDCASGAA